MEDSGKGLFTRLLMNWNKSSNRRQMPWKGISDPYKIWLSEIILQQTRVEQGTAYYERFVQKFPGIRQLAAASEKEVFKLWEGLGYYSRCRNLMTTARTIVSEFDGQFPDTYEQIVALKGIGPYTAAAIASFAYNLPYAVTDGNVMRVLARFFGIEADIASTTGKRLFADLSHALLPKGRSAMFNQAIMDFGATVCKPALPLCAECPMAKHCLAYKENKVKELPVKSAKQPKKTRFMNYVVAEHRGGFLVRRREEKDIWKHLFEFLLLETNRQTEPAELMKSPLFKQLAGKSFSIVSVSKLYKQALTHREVRGFFIHISIKGPRPRLAGYEWQNRKELLQLAFPRFINLYLEDQRLAVSG